MDKKQEIVYGILTGKMLLPFLIRATRKQAIREFLEWSARFSTWEDAQNAGFTVKKFRLQEITNKKSK